MKISDVTLDKNYYMNEGCGAFAFILANMIEGDVYILSNKDGEAWSNSIPYEVTHAVAVKDSVPYDVTGSTSKEKISQYFNVPVSDLLIKGPYSPDQFKRKFLGTNDKYPLYPADSLIQREVTSYIQDNENIFLKKA